MKIDIPYALEGHDDGINDTVISAGPRFAHEGIIVFLIVLKDKKE